MMDLFDKAHNYYEPNKIFKYLKIEFIDFLNVLNREQLKQVGLYETKKIKYDFSNISNIKK